MAHATLDWRLRRRGIFTNDKTVVDGEDVYSDTYRNAAYSVIHKEAVCAGYANLYKVVCNYFDIPCVYGRGTVTGGGHAWNYVEIDGIWYGVDLTWADSNTNYAKFFTLEEFYSHEERTELSFTEIKTFNTANETLAFDYGTDQNKTNESDVVNKNDTNTNKTDDTKKEPVNNSTIKNNVKYTVKGNTVTAQVINKKVKTITIANTVRINKKTHKVNKITNSTFKGCTKLKTVTLGKNITKIPKNTFKTCKVLKKLTIKSKILKVARNAIKGINKKAIIKVPGTRKKAYIKLFKTNTGFKKTMKIK